MLSDPSILFHAAGIKLLLGEFSARRTLDLGRHPSIPTPCPRPNRADLGGS